MTTYDNDPRVTVLYPDWWWLVAADASSFWYLCPTGQFAVVKGDDGLYRVFEDEPGREGGRRMGNQLPRIPAGNFDTVVHALIGDPR